MPMPVGWQRSARDERTKLSKDGRELNLTSPSRQNAAASFTSTRQNHMLQESIGKETQANSIKLDGIRLLRHFLRRLVSVLLTAGASHVKTGRVRNFVFKIHRDAGLGTSFRRGSERIQDRKIKLVDLWHRHFMIQLHVGSSTWKTWLQNVACYSTWEAAEKALPEAEDAPWGPALSGRYKSKACQTPSETMKSHEI